MPSTLFAAAPDPALWARVTGSAVYGADLRLPGMLQGKILRSPHPHARIVTVDASAARSMPGVRAVLTGEGEDLPRAPYGIAAADELVLARGVVRYVGDEVAAVAAVDEKTALKALQSIVVRYEPLPAVFEPSAALSESAPRLHAQFPGNIAWERSLERGSPAEAFGKADLVVENTYRIPALHPAYLEPVSCIAENDRGGGLVIHTALQSPQVVRDLLASVLGVPLSRLRIVGPAMGGGFGGKVYGNLKLYLVAALLAMRCGLPVKMGLDREEEFAVGRPMIAAEIRMKMALDKTGMFLAREADIITDNGAYSAQAPWVSKTLSERNDSVYRIPAVKTRVRLVYTNKVPTGQYRAYGNQAANFATESLIDEAAKKLGIDRLNIRLRNCTRSGDVTVHGLKIKSCALSDCLQEAAQQIGWGRRKKGRGYGISAAIHANGSLVFDRSFRGAAALARLELDGRVTIFTGEQDYGQGTHETFSRIAARALGIDRSLVSVQSADTLYSPWSLGALAMRQTTVGGRAVQLAAEDLRRKILQTASEMAGEPVSKIERGLLVGESGRTFEPAEAARFYRSQTSGLNLMGEGKLVPPESPCDGSGYGDISLTYSFAAHAAEVEVDRETGALTVLRVVAAHDSGRIINETAARGQVFGGVTQGLGMACFEGYIFEEGRVANASFADYKIPTSLDIPEIEPLFLGEPDPVGPYGAKGLGEIVQVPAAGAVANAVADAIGSAILDLPITAEKIYGALANWECAR